MINIELQKTWNRTTSKFKFAPKFSERRLLLLVGDTVFMSLAGALAFWVQSLL